MHMKVNDDETDLMDLVSIWTFELLDSSISLENYFQLENALLQSDTARELFTGSMQLHSDLIGMFSDTPDYLQRGLRRAEDLLAFVSAEADRVNVA